MKYNLIFSLFISGVINAVSPVGLFNFINAEASKNDTDLQIILSHIYTRIPESTDQQKKIKGALAKRFEEKYGKTIQEVIPSVSSNIKDSPEYKQLQASIQADATLIKSLEGANEEQKVRAVSKLFTEPGASGSAVVDALRQKKATHQKVVKDTAQQIIDVLTPLTQ